MREVARREAPKCDRFSNGPAIIIKYIARNVSDTECTGKTKSPVETERGMVHCPLSGRAVFFMFPLTQGVGRVVPFALGYDPLPLSGRAFSLITVKRYCSGKKTGYRKPQIHTNKGHR